MASKLYNLQEWRASLSGLLPVSFQPLPERGQENTGVTLLETMSNAIKESGRIALTRGISELRKTPSGQFLEQEATNQKIREVFASLSPIFVIIGVVLTFSIMMIMLRR